MRILLAGTSALFACDPCPEVVPLHDGTPSAEARFNEVLEEFRGWTGGAPQCLRGVTFATPPGVEVAAAGGASTWGDLYVDRDLDLGGPRFSEVIRHELCHLLHFEDPFLVDTFPAPEGVKPFAWMSDRRPDQQKSEWFANTCELGPEHLSAVRLIIRHCPSMQDTANRIDFLLDEVFVGYDAPAPGLLPIPDLRTTTLEGHRLHPPTEAISSSTLVLQPQVRYSGADPVQVNLNTGESRPFAGGSTYPANEPAQLPESQLSWTDHATVDFGPWRLTGATAQLPGDLLVGALRVEQPGQPVRMFDACLGGIPVPLDTGAPFPWFFHIEDSNRLSWAPIVLP